MSEIFRWVSWLRESGLLELWGILSVPLMPPLVLWVRRHFRLRTLRLAFNREAKDAEDFIISLPLWSVKSADRSSARFSRSDPSGRVTELFGPTNTFAKEDVVGALQISDIFASVFPKSVSIITDDQKIDITDKTAIIVGAPTANFHGRDLLDHYKGQHSRDLILHFNEIEENNNTGAKFIIADRFGHNYAESLSSEYAFVIRMKNRLSAVSGRYVFIIGGVHACGTLAASLYLKNNWRRFARLGGVNAVVLRVSRGRPEIYEEARVY